ncbi:hypothetical protein [Streptomyces lycii]|uniref:Uncharacterized protein n=1 Tax=Streptomyces lycii TaxID=2654337 RepID=A0ABQ7F9D0_9ACTN|nr:hypothetical protein [Streptomyces lycii]KAF4405594.1 hypothetical protein GCU69_29455 [Streptomyces lycii]
MPTRVKVEPAPGPWQPPAGRAKQPGRITPAARAYRDRRPDPERWTEAEWETYGELGGIA